MCKITFWESKKNTDIYLPKVSSRCLTRMTFRFAFKTSFEHLQDVLARCLAYLGKTSCRCLFADWAGVSGLFDCFLK